LKTSAAVLQASALLMLAVAIRDAPAQVTSQQTWVGVIAADGFIAVRLNVRTSARGLTATLDFTNQGPERQALAVDSLVLDDRRFHAEWTDADGRAALDGEMIAGKSGQERSLQGTFAQGTQKGRFFLAPGASVDRAAVSRAYGLYELEGGGLLWLGEVSELSRRPGFVDSRTGRFGALYPRSTDSLFSGTTALVPSPAGVWAHVTQRAWPSGNVLSLTWSEDGSAPVVAKRVDPYTTEEVLFYDDTVRLTGTLVLPKIPGAHPAVVYIHGSGGGTRGYFSSLPFLLAARGIASLVYDKRGSGGSSGNRHISSFENLADDALSAVRYLQSRKEIDARHIGLYGHSQGGWVAPLAASRARGAVAFVVAVAGPAKDFEHQTNDEIRNVMLENGMTDADIQHALEHQRLWWRVVRQQASYAELVKANEKAQSEPWSRFVFSGRLPPDTTLDPPGGYDPKPVLEHLTVPILAIYGERDNRVMGAENARLMEGYLRRARNPDFTVKLFARANHDILDVGDWSANDLLRTRSYADGYFEYLVSWIVRHATPH
jgi:uncharacterized protein